MELQYYGVYKVGDLLNAAGITVEQNTDRRRYKIGGLGFDDTDQTIRVVGDTLEVTDDGAVVHTFTVVGQTPVVPQPTE